MNNNKTLKIVYSLLPLLLFACLAFVYSIFFYSNDDKYILGVFSGAFTLKPHFETMYVNFVLGGFISNLYYLLPSIPWYPLFIVGSTIICSCLIFNIIYDQNKKNYFILILFPLIFFSLIIYFYLFVSYTVTSLLYGIASLMLLSQYLKYNKQYYLINSLLLLIVSVIVRTAPSFTVLLFWALYFIYILFKNKNNKIYIKKTLALTFILFCLYGLFYFTDDYLKKNVIEPNDYVELTNAKANFVDYPIKSITEEEIQAELKNIDISYNDYLLTRRYVTLNDSFDESRYKALSNSLTVRLNYEDSIYLLKDTIADNHFVFVSIVYIIFSFASAFIFMDKNKSYLLLKLMFALLSLILIAYLCYRGRLLIHAIIVAVLPSICIMFTDYNLANIETKTTKNLNYFLILVLNLLCIYTFTVLLSKFVIVPALLIDIYLIAKKFNNNIVKIFKNLVFVIMLVYFVYNLSLLNANMYNSFPTQQRRTEALSHNIIDEYCENNKDNLYILNTEISHDIRMYYTNKISNKMVMGGTSYGSVVFNNQLLLNNIDAFNFEMFRKENVYYIDKYQGILSLLNTTMKEKGYKGQFELVERVSDFEVYKYKE